MIEKKLYFCFKKIFNKKIPKKITNLEMKNFELWDSLSHMNLMLEIEKKFSFQFTTKEFAQLNNYKKIFQRLKNIK